jgi:hypothetical protein
LIICSFWGKPWPSPIEVCPKAVSGYKHSQKCCRIRPDLKDLRCFHLRKLRYESRSYWWIPQLRHLVWKSGPYKTLVEVLFVLEKSRPIFGSFFRHTDQESF